MTTITASSLFVFGTAVALAQSVPGPTTSALVSRVVARGARGIVFFCGGLVIGELFWLAGAMFGLAAIVAAAGSLFLALRILGGLYLLYLGWQLWSADVSGYGTQPAAVERKNLAIAGLALALGNPKTMLFYLALVPALLPLRQVSARDFAVSGLMVVAIYAVVLGSYVLLAAQFRHFFSAPKAIRIVNRVSAIALAIAALFILGQTAAD